MLEPIPGRTDDFKIVSFTSITAVPLSMHDDFMEKKIAELNHETRISSKSKEAGLVLRPSRRRHP